MTPTDNPLVIVSQALGWTYFLAWSASFYPQVVLNHKRRSVVGLSFDFVVLNFLGFSCLTAVSTAFLFSEEIRDEYRRRNGGNDPLVDPNDLVFAVHALLLTFVALVQIALFDRGDQRVSAFAWSFLGVALTLIGGATMLVGLPQKPLDMNLAWLDVIYLLSYIKLAVTTVKYVPQVFLNMSRASTSGWSIVNIWLDATGGLLSWMQLFLDAQISGHWDGIWGNPVKLGMSLLSLSFDAVFFAQHYVFYKPSSLEDGRTEADTESGRVGDEVNEQDPLLGRR